MATVLLLEPDAKLSDSYEAALTSGQHQVTVCRTVEQAVRSLDIERPDVIVMELQLGLHNGLEFLYELRSYDDWQDIPVLIQSGVAERSLTRSPVYSQYLNIAAYLYKPTTKLKTLVQSVNRHARVIA